METILVVIVILALGGGAALLLARKRVLPASLPSLRPGGDTRSPLDSSEAAAEAAIGSPRSRQFSTFAIAAAPLAPKLPPVTTDKLREQAPLDLAPAHSDISQPRLDRIEARLEELQRAVARQSEHHADASRRLREELTWRAEAEVARREAAHERMRADLLADMSRLAADRQIGVSNRRLEVSAELYAQLARLEAALATVTNPILLPGEPYAPPEELAPEAFIWENWNEVGERAFALAETYSAQRLHLSAQTRSDIGEFVTTLRTLLTRSIYPNLQADASSERHAALLAALAEVAADMPRVRDLLETEYLKGQVR